MLHGPNLADVPRLLAVIRYLAEPVFAHGVGSGEPLRFSRFLPRLIKERIVAGLILQLGRQPVNAVCRRNSGRFRFLHVEGAAELLLLSLLPGMVPAQRFSVEIEETPGFRRQTGLRRATIPAIAWSVLPLTRRDLTSSSQNARSTAVAGGRHRSGSRADWGGWSSGYCL